MEKTLNDYTKLSYFQCLHGLPVTGKMDKETSKYIVKTYNIQNGAGFLGQMDWESGGFKAGREDLRYSEKALMNFSYYKKRPAEAKADAYKAQTIANKVYADKNRTSKLGNTQPNDGYYFRGNGAIQLTGRDNHKRFESWLINKGYPIKRNDIMLNPDLVWQQYYIESALFYFETNNLWGIKDNLSLSRAINLGNRNSKLTPNHLKERAERTEYYKKLIA